jgi:hypothetical protein
MIRTVLDQRQKIEAPCAERVQAITLGNFS